MNDQHNFEPALPDDDPLADAEDVLQLHLPLLLDLLERLKTRESPAALRTAIAELRCRVAEAEDELRKTLGGQENITISQDYLLGEFDQIAASLTIERARYYIDRLIRSLTTARTLPINDINLNRWKEYEDIVTDSLWIVERRDRSGVHRADYWGNFIPQIPQQMLRRYTKKGEWVLDPFAGSGTTLIEGQRLGRNTIGIELQPAIAERASALIAAEPNPHGVITRVVSGDSATCDYQMLLARHDRRAVQLVIMHPPYFDIIKFSSDPRDLSNATSVDEFLALLGKVADNALRVLDKGRYLVLVIGDKYARGEWIPLGFLAMNELLKRDLSLKSIVVKNFEQTTGKRSQHELWRYRAMAGGFYVFKHEYIFIFKRT